MARCVQYGDANLVTILFVRLIGATQSMAEAAAAAALRRRRRRSQSCFARSPISHLRPPCAPMKNPLKMKPRFGANLVIILSFLCKQVWSSCPCRVSRFYWYDADRDKELEQPSLRDGDVVYETDFEKSIEAYVYCPDRNPDGMKVYLKISGPINYDRTERQYRYFLFGDIDSGVRIHGRHFGPGSYRLKAQIKGDDCDAEDAKEIDFSVVPPAVTCPCFDEDQLSLDVFPMPDPSTARFRTYRNEGSDDGENQDYWSYSLPDAWGRVSVFTMELYDEGIYDCSLGYTLCDEGDYREYPEVSGDSCRTYYNGVSSFTGDAAFQDCETLLNQAGADRGLPCYDDLPDNLDDDDGYCRY